MLKAWRLYCHRLHLIQQVSWISKKFLEYAPSQSGTPRNSPSPLSSSLPWDLSPFSKISHVRSTFALFNRLQGSTPWVTEPELPRWGARPHPRAQRAGSSGARCAALIRCGWDCGARAPPAPRSAAPAGAASVCLQPAATASPALQPGPLTPECPLPAPRTATASPQSPHDAGHCRFHQDGLCVEQLEKSGYSLYFSNACLRRTGTRDPDSAIVHHFTCGTSACFIPKSFLLGGVNLLCQKSKWVVFDVFSFPHSFIFPPTATLFVFLLSS